MHVERILDQKFSKIIPLSSALKLWKGDWEKFFGRPYRSNGSKSCPDLAMTKYFRNTPFFYATSVRSQPSKLFISQGFFGGGLRVA